MQMVANNSHDGALCVIKSQVPAKSTFVKNLITFGIANNKVMGEVVNLDQIKSEIEHLINKNNEKIWKWLYELGVEEMSVDQLFKQDVYGNTVLTDVIIDGLEKAAHWLISGVKDCNLLDISNNDNLTALHLAVKSGSAFLARALVIAGASVESRTEEGNTPLHLACIYDDLDCLQALTLPFTPQEKQDLHESLKSSDGPMIDFDNKNYAGRTCLHLAVANGNAAIVQYLLAAGADANAPEGLGGYTALHMAAERGFNDVAHVLASSAVCRLDAKTYGGFTAYQVAFDCCNFDLAAFLQAIGADTRMKC